jgi:hypothetical protein
VIAFALLLVISATVTMATLAVGGGVMDDTRTEVELQHAETTLRAFDQRATAVALGGNPSATVDLEGGGGYTVDSTAGWLRVEHRDYSGGRTETVYNGSLGALVHRNGDTRLAYQGGGIWRQDATGGTVMVAPPALQYRNDTLSLPVVGIRGTDSAAGRTTAHIAADSRTGVFPGGGTPVGESTEEGGDADEDGGDGTENGPPGGDSSSEGTGGGSWATGPGAPYDATGDPYRNVIDRGTVAVTVHSEYYRGWVRYFRGLDAGRVSVDHDAETATLLLPATGSLGPFQMPPEGEAVPARGLPARHALGNFTVVLAPDDVDNARFNNLKWSLYAEDGDRRFEVHLRKGTTITDQDAACKRNSVEATVYYTEGDGTYHGWHDDHAFATDCVDRDGDGVADETRLVANFSGDTALELQPLSSSELLQFQPDGQLADPARLAGHDADWEPRSVDPGEEVAVGKLVNHYTAALGPDVDFVVDDKSANTVTETSSRGRLEYDDGPRVRFLHVSTARLVVRLD